MASRFEIEVLTKFRSVGLSQIAQEARTALSGVANQPGLSSAQRATRANQIRTEAERAIARNRDEQLAAARSSGLSGNALAAEEARIKSEAQKVRQRVNRIFREIETGSTDLGRRINEALKKAGINLRTGAEARADARTTGPPPTGAEALAAQRAARAAERAKAAQLLENDPAYYASVQTAKRAEANRRAREAEQAKADRAYIDATGRAARAKREEADRVAASAAGVRGAATAPIDEVRVATALQQKVQADLHGARVARARALAEQNSTGALARASAERRAAERQLNAAIHANARAEVNAAIAAGEGTKFQRLQARFQAGGSNRLPSEFQTLGGFTGSRALTTIGYGVAGTALYGTVRAIGEMIREAEELDRILNQIEAQLQETDAAGQFPEARQGILDIARATGAQADEIASVQFQFQGAFRNAATGQVDVQEALKQTEAAIKITAITGLSLQEVLDSLTATAKTFKVDIADIGDVALGVQERFGVLARETITFIADLAPVAEQVGLSLEDTASLAGVAQQVSGRSGAALAEGFGRILPQLQEVRGEILQIYNLPQLKDKQVEIAQAFGAGETGAVFKQLVEDYGSLNEQQQQFVINLLGGRREAQVLIPILQNSATLVDEWSKNAAGLNDQTGKTNDYFADLRDTVQNTQARMSEAFKQIGEALFRAGLADGLKTAANAAAFLADSLGLVFDLLERINSIGAPLDALIPGDLQVFDNLPGKLLLIALTMGTVNKAFEFFRGVLTATAAAETAEAAASAANAAANTAQAGAAELVVVAKGQEAAATRAALAADVAETASSSANAAANAAQAGGGLLGRAGRLARGVPGLFTRGGAAAASGVGVAGVVSAGALVVGNEYLNQRGEIKNIEDSYIEQLKTYSNEQLRAITQQTTDFWGRVSTRFFGAELPEELAAEQLVRNESADPAKNITSLLARNEDQLIEALKAATGSTTEEVFRAILEANKTRFDDTKLDDILGASLKSGLDPSGRYVTSVTGVDEDDITPDKIRELLKAAQEDGDALAAMAIQKINQFIQDNEELAELLGLSLTQDVEDAAIEAAGGKAQYALQTLDSVRAQYESGQISSGAYLKKIQEVRDTAKLQADSSDNAEDDEAFFKADKELREFLGEIQIKRVEQLSNMIDLLSGGNAEKRATGLLDQQIALLTQFVASDQGTQEQRFAQVPELIALLRDRFERDLAKIADDTERARAEARGFKIPTELQAAVVEEQLVASPEISAALQAYADLAGKSLDETFRQAAITLVTTDKSVKEITREMILAAIRKLQRVAIQMAKDGIDTEGIHERIEGLKDLLPTIPDIAIEEPGGTGYAGSSGGGPDPEDEAEKARRAARARAEALLDIERARADGDPVALAQIDIRAAQVARQYAEDDAERLQAEAERIRAYNALEEAQADITRARYELYAAQVQRDPVRSAQRQVQLAYIAISQAKGQADRIRAQIQMVNAQAQLVQAQQDVTYAWLEGVISYFNIIGDSVRAAQLALQLAQQKLADVLKDSSSGAAERTRARTAVQEAEAALRDARYNDQLGDIEYMLELEKISVAQAIQMLQRMAEIPGLTEEQLRNIERRIKALREEVSGDLNFNIPDIVVPGLYEVRRLMGASTTNSGTYQDNRQIAVTLQISSDVDTTAVMNQLADLLDAPAVSGITPRIY